MAAKRKTTRRRSTPRKTTTRRRRRTYRRNPPIVKQIQEGLVNGGWTLLGRSGSNIIAQQVAGFLPAELSATDIGRLASQTGIAFVTATVAGMVAPKKAQPFIVAGAFALPMETAIRTAAEMAGADFITSAMSGMGLYPGGGMGLYPSLAALPAPGLTTLEGMDFEDSAYYGHGVQ